MFRNKLVTQKRTVFCFCVTSLFLNISLETAWLYDLLLKSYSALKFVRFFLLPAGVFDPLTPADWLFRARRPCLSCCRGTCLERASIFCHWLGYCSHLQESLEDVSFCEVSFLRQGPRKKVCFKLPHSH